MRLKKLFCSKTTKLRRGRGSRLVGGTRLDSSRKPRAGTPSRAGTPYPLPLPKQVQRGGKGVAAGRGIPARRGVEVFLGLYGVKKRGNTTNRVPPTSQDPSHFPKKWVKNGHFATFSPFFPVGPKSIFGHFWPFQAGGPIWGLYRAIGAMFWLFLVAFCLFFRASKFLACLTFCLLKIESSVLILSCSPLLIRF